VRTSYLVFSMFPLIVTLKIRNNPKGRTVNNGNENIIDTKETFEKSPNLKS
jgi:hypothetical protein